VPTRKKLLMGGAAVFAIIGVIGATQDGGKHSAAARAAASTTASTSVVAPHRARHSVTARTARQADANLGDSGTVTVHEGTTASSAATLRNPARGTALSVLAKLPTKGRAPMTGYSRDKFGPAWSDNTNAVYGHNGCDTRDDILAVQLRHLVRPDGCKVTSGDETDHYTGTSLFYVRGRSTVDMDHVVALGDAWQKGAQQLAATLRQRLANDPLNLLAVSASANRAKGDADAASWLPKVKSYRCAYVARQVAVKYRYSLWVTAAERDAIRRILETCPGQQVPTGGAGKAAPARQTSTPTPSPTKSPTSSPTPPPTDLYYANCDAVRAAGKAPLYRGQPGYRSGLDRDGDGVACEN
jgi:hypothetical protein